MKCPQTGKKAIHVPTYLQKDKNGKVTKGAAGPSGRPEAYLDAPQYNTTFKITAYCRCECEDDRQIDEKTFPWDSKDHQKNLATLRK